MSVQELNPLSSVPTSSTSRTPPPILTAQKSKSSIEAPRTGHTKVPSSYADASAIASPITPRMHNRLHSHLFEGAASPAAPSPITKPRRDNNSWVGVGVSVEENSRGQPVIRNSYQHVSKRPSAEQILFDDLKKPVSGTLATIYPIGGEDDNDPYSFRIMDPTPVVSDFPDTFETPMLDRNDSRNYVSPLSKNGQNQSTEAVPIVHTKSNEISELPTKKILSEERLNGNQKSKAENITREKKPTSDHNLKNKDVERVPLQDASAIGSPRVQLQKTKSRSSFLGFLKKKEGSTEELVSSKGDLKDRDVDRKHRSFFFAKKTSSSNLLDDQKHAIGSNNEIKDSGGETKEKHRSFFFAKKTSTSNLLEDHKPADVPAAPPPPPPTVLKELGVEPKIEKLKPEIELNKKIATLENTVKVLQEVVDRLTKENEALKKQVESKVE
ncbi:hypothetical protein HDV06_000039 [Boothiomyces sp. JEL0866]|nr:hypothetical protein HDV06_000039 [Boothiomyces sp. JEL0866]